MTRLTEDDSLLASLQGSIDPTQHAKHPLRNVLTNVLGARDETDVHVSDVPMPPASGCCSAPTGSTASSTTTRIATELADAPTPRLASERLVAAALDAKGRDNVTALVVDATRRDDTTETHARNLLVTS